MTFYEAFEFLNHHPKGKFIAALDIDVAMVNPVTREIDCLSGMIISWRTSDFQIPEFDALEQKIKSEIRSPHFLHVSKGGGFCVGTDDCFLTAGGTCGKSKLSARQM